MKKKRNFKTYFKPFVFLIAISILLLNCTNENNVEPLEIVNQKKREIRSLSVNHVEGLKDYVHTIGKKVNKYRSYGKTTDRSVEDLNLDLNRIIEVTDSLGYESLTLTILNATPETIERLLLVKDGEDYIPSIYQFKPNANWIEDGKVKSITNFSGEVTKFDAEGGIIFQRELENGIVINNPTNTASRGGNDCTLQTFYEDEEGNTYSSLGDDDFAECFTLIYEYTCYFGGSSSDGSPGGGGNDTTNDETNNNDTGGGGSNTGGAGNSTEGTGNNNQPDNVGISLTEEEKDKIELFDCLFSTPQETIDNTSAYNWLNSQVGVRPAYNTIFNDYAQANGCNEETKSFLYLAAEALENGGEVDFEEQIINNLTGKDKCVYNKLKSLDLFKSTIGEFTEGFYNLTFTNEGECNGGVGEEACTDPVDLESGNITINMLGTASNELDYATTLLHEGVHASIYRYVDQFNQGLDPNNRQNLFYYYNFYKAQNSNDFATAIAQHQYMQDKFVIPIAEAIRKLDGNRYPLEDYYGFGWEGLKEDYDYDHYIDINGNVQTMTPDKYNELITKKDTIASSSNFAEDCN